MENFYPSNALALFLKELENAGFNPFKDFIIEEEIDTRTEKEVDGKFKHLLPNPWMSFKFRTNQGFYFRTKLNGDFFFFHIYPNKNDRADDNVTVFMNAPKSILSGLYPTHIEKFQTWLEKIKEHDNEDDLIDRYKQQAGL